jgi:hypothetical protein
MPRADSDRKAGGERPKAEGEKPVGRERWFSERSPLGREKMEGSEGDWSLGGGWNWRPEEREAG